MPINPTGSVDVPLELFGGDNLELSPADLPEGVSPGTQDMIFLPGSTQSRPCTRRILNTPLGSVTVVYAKTYVQPNGEPLNLYLDSAGNLWKEDVTNSPGAVTQIGTVPAGSYMNSVTDPFSGREFIATHDGKHGSGPPLAYDGTNLDRISMDGPAVAPTVADDETVFNLSAGAVTVVFSPFTISATGLSEVGNIVTVVTTFNSALPIIKNGDWVQISGATDTDYNGTFQVTGISFAGSVFSFTFIHTKTALPNSGNGTATFGVLEVTTSVANSFAVGDSVILAGVNVVGYNGTWAVRTVVSNTQFTINTNQFGLGTGGGGFLYPAGGIAVGTHQCVYMFLTRSGYITAPSPATSWSAQGDRKCVVSGIATGPTNVIARVFAFTGAGGDNFFTATSSITFPNPSGTTPIILKALVIPDNTSTSATLDFSDNQLFAAQAIDISGNNLFAQITVKPCMGMFPYASRMLFWGEPNALSNLLNMGFDGGTTGGSLPTGWTVGSQQGIVSGGSVALVNAGSTTAEGFGFALQMNGAGTVLDALVGQSLYQDAEGIPIAAQNTTYSLNLLAKRSGTTTGSFQVSIYSHSQNKTYGFARIPLSEMTSTYTPFSITPNGATPSTIPSDLVLFYLLTGVPTGTSVTIDETSLVPSIRPYFTGFHASYVDNPEAVDGTTGVVAPTSDSSQVQTATELRDILTFNTLAGMHQTQDNGITEPSGWNVREISKKVGALSSRAVDPGELGAGASAEDWNFIASRTGLYVYDNAEPVLISQEIAPSWAQINWSAASTIWVKNDNINRRVYIGLPVGSAVTPNIIRVLDYRELSTAGLIEGSGPIHISFTGKMISSDLTRKWTTWNLAANCGELLVRPNTYGGTPNTLQFCIGAGDGNTLGNTGFGNIYQFDSSLLTDEDYGAMVPYYTTYAFINHEAEQALGTGVHMKLYAYLAAFMSGVGNVRITPLVDTTANAQSPLPEYPLSLTPTGDLEWGVNVTGERCFFKIEILPNAGQTDVQINIQKLISTLRVNPWYPVRGAI